MIHIINYEIKHWQQMSASAWFKTIVKTRHSTGIKQALGVNRYKGMGTSWRESNQNYVTIRQQSSKRSIQSKLSLKTSVQVKIRSGSHNSQSETADLYKRWILRWGKWSIFDEGQILIRFLSEIHGISQNSENSKWVMRKTKLNKMNVLVK